jgi:hypothetical protein
VGRPQPAGHGAEALAAAREGQATTPGGPETTFALDLPVPEGTTRTTLADLYGRVLPSPGAGPVVRLTLTPAVQYLSLAR